MPYETRSQTRERHSREVERSQWRLRESIEQAKRLVDQSDALIHAHRDHNSLMRMRPGPSKTS